MFKVYVSQTRKLSRYQLLTVNVSYQGFNSILTSKVSLQDPLQCLKTLQSAQWQVSLLFEKKGKLAKMATRCHSHSLSLVVTRHSLSLVVIYCHSLPFVVTRCLSLYHSLSFVVTRTTRCHLFSLDFFTRLLFYKRFAFVLCCIITLF